MFTWWIDYGKHLYKVVPSIWAFPKKILTRNRQTGKGHRPQYFYTYKQGLVTRVYSADDELNNTSLPIIVQYFSNNYLRTNNSKQTNTRSGEQRVFAIGGGVIWINFDQFLGSLNFGEHNVQVWWPECVRDRRRREGDDARAAGARAQVKIWKCNWKWNWNCVGQQEHERRWKYENIIENKIESVWVSRSTSAGENIKI